MGETITIELPQPLARRAKEIAARTHRRVEDVVVEWLDQIATEPPVESLPDDQVLALSSAQMPEEQQAELSQLLALHREQALDPIQRDRLDELMELYRRGLVRKAQALKVAVERGLRPPLN